MNMVAEEVVQFRLSLLGWLHSTVEGEDVKLIEMRSTGLELAATGTLLKQLCDLSLSRYVAYSTTVLGQTLCEGELVPN